MKKICCIALAFFAYLYAHAQELIIADANIIKENNEYFLSIGLKNGGIDSVYIQDLFQYYDIEPINKDAIKANSDTLKKPFLGITLNLALIISDSAFANTSFRPVYHKRSKEYRVITPTKYSKVQQKIYRGTYDLSTWNEFLTEMGVFMCLVPKERVVLKVHINRQVFLANTYLAESINGPQGKYSPVLPSSYVVIIPKFYGFYKRNIKQVPSSIRLHFNPIKLMLE